MGQNGGKRPGAGRKPKAVTEAKREAQRNWAGEILSDADEKKHWLELLSNPKERPDAMRYLSDQKHGKAPQSVDITQKDTRSLTFGGLSMPTRPELGTAGKPN